MDEKTQKDLALSTDNSLFMLQEKGGAKCNTPELQRKNLLEVAKTTVDKMKNTVRVKRQELIDMVYISHEADTDNVAEKYESCSISSLFYIHSLTKHIQLFFNLANRNLKTQWMSAVSSLRQNCGLVKTTQILSLKILMISKSRIRI